MTSTTYRRGNTPGRTGRSRSRARSTWSASVRNAQMLRNYMNDGGKVVVTGRNGWLQQLSTNTTLNTYSGYSWWQEPVYGFTYPPDQAGDDDRPHTAFFRELDISNDWAQWWLGVGARQGGAGTTTYNAAAVVPVTGGILDGVGDITLDTSAGAGPTEDRRERGHRCARAACEGADAPSVDVLHHVPAAVPPGDRGRGLHRRRGAQRRRGRRHAGLRRDQLRTGADHGRRAQRNEVVDKVMDHLLPESADSALRR